jgi:transcriptional regulator with XRE-family HTH domain
MKLARPLHRIAAVRRREGLSLQDASEILGIPVDFVVWQERETSDLQLDELWAWQRALDVPVEDLLIDPYSPMPSTAVTQKQIHRAMKTTLAIAHRTASFRIQRMAKRIAELLLEIVP